MGNYILAAAIIIVIGFLGIFILFTLPIKSRAKIKIYISSENSDETEKAIMSTYHFCSRYFKNAEIYICGDDETYINLLIRAYRFLKRDDTVGGENRQC